MATSPPDPDDVIADLFIAWPGYARLQDGPDGSRLHKTSRYLTRTFSPAAIPALGVLEGTLRSANLRYGS